MRALACSADDCFDITMLRLLQQLTGAVGQSSEKAKKEGVKKELRRPPLPKSMPSQLITPRLFRSIFGNYIAP